MRYQTLMRQVNTWFDMAVTTVGRLAVKLTVLEKQNKCLLLTTLRLPCNYPGSLSIYKFRTLFLNTCHATHSVYQSKTW